MFTVSSIQEAANNPLIKILNVSNLKKENIKTIFQDFDFLNNRGSASDFKNRVFWIVSILGSNRTDLAEEFLSLIKNNFKTTLMSTEEQIRAIPVDTNSEKLNEKLQNFKKTKENLLYSFRELSDVIFKSSIINKDYDLILPVLKEKGFHYDRFVMDRDTAELVFTNPNYEEKMLKIFKTLSSDFDFKKFNSLSYSSLIYREEMENDARVFLKQLEYFINSRHFNFDSIQKMSLDVFKKNVHDFENNFNDSIARMDCLEFKKNVIETHKNQYLQYDSCINSVLDKVDNLINSERNHHLFYVDINPNIKKSIYPKIKLEQTNMISNASYLFENAQTFLSQFSSGKKIDAILERELFIPFKDNNKQKQDEFETYILPALAQGFYPLDEVFGYLESYCYEGKFSKDSKIISKLKDVISVANLNITPQEVKSLLEDGMSKHLEQFEKLTIQHELQTVEKRKSKRKVKIL